ncbi:hypothetical protein O181_036715 [Austropuccinia psidii MF-1]|uniref:RanBD1 domain-containing protein n=1 Tax=Austropuccinia psidii MF-1 TaxID=1389203 RepID=A0A9Q3D9H2_9BASI|nr:hypothetical protein [Austropuccinia psidii MF-1]
MSESDSSIHSPAQSDRPSDRPSQSEREPHPSSTSADKMDDEHVHGIKRSRESNQFDPSRSDSENQAKSNLPISHSEKETLGVRSLHEDSDLGHPKSQRLTPEATEVKSVRKKVEGMGVETQLESTSSDLAPSNNPSIPSLSTDSQKDPNSEMNTSINQDPNVTSISDSANLPPSWAAYVNVQSPFMSFAPKTTPSLFATTATTTAATSLNQPPTSSTPPPHRPVARAFVTPKPSPAKSKTLPSAFSNYVGGPPLASDPTKFPSGSDFFLKGKRNIPLGGSPSDDNFNLTTQNKKVKLPQSSDSSSQGFVTYSSNHPVSLKSDALEKLNNNPSLQIPSATVPFLNVNTPGSQTTSVCAIDGDPDDLRSPPRSTSSSKTNFSHFTPSHSTTLGFSAFANHIGFIDPSKTDKITPAGSFFDQGSNPDKAPPPTNKEPDQTEEWGDKLSSKKTHLALSAELSQEDKCEGFLAQEVITGEEDEVLIKSIRCKVFTLGDDGSWHERGSGGLRLLRTKQKPYRYRFIMRADAVLRVLLNVPIFKGFSYRPTQDKFLSFASQVTSSSIKPSEIVDGEINGQADSQAKSQFQQYLCRFGRTEARQEMIDSIEGCLVDLNSKSEEDQNDDLGNQSQEKEEIYGEDSV